MKTYHTIQDPNTTQIMILERRIIKECNIIKEECTDKFALMMVLVSTQKDNSSLLEILMVDTKTKISGMNFHTETTDLMNNIIN